jgi:CRP-like cAMP-binding protein
MQALICPKKVSNIEHAIAAKACNNPHDNHSSGDTMPKDFNVSAFLEKVSAEKNVITYKKGETIYKQGEYASAVYYILSGRVKITVVSEQGKEAVVGMLEQGQFFGEGAFIRGHVIRVATTTAMMPAKIICVEIDKMKELMLKEPALTNLFVMHLVKRNMRIEEDLTDQLFNQSERRLARLLLILANVGTDNKPTPIDGKISQETLAEMIGTTRSRVSHFMNKFRKLGFIKYNGQIEVRRSLLDAVLHERPEIDSKKKN